ncbi:MAG: ATP-binding protein [Sedimenticolaceae bacterium]
MAFVVHFRDFSGQEAPHPVLPLDLNKTSSRPQVADGTHALQGLMGVESLKHSAWLAGLSGGALLILAAIVAWLGTVATGLDSVWLGWASASAMLAAFGGSWLARQLISRKHLTRWRLVLVVVMALNGTAWAFASAVGEGLQPSPVALLMITWPAMALALVPSLSWPLGLGLQLLAQLLLTLGVGILPEFGARELLLPLGMWFSLATLAVMAALYAKRSAILQGELHFMKFESAELQKRFDHAQSSLSTADQQRKTIESELAEILNLAEDADRTKTEFLATMSHEIRTPLNGILPILEMLCDTPLNADQMKLVRTAQGSSRHLLRIINDVLDFAKVESGKLQLETIEIEVRDLVDSVTELMSGSAQNRNLQLSARVADNVPQVVRGDPIRLRQILINLVSNAIKFTEQGGIRVEVSRGQSSEKEVELLFAVADTGVGMSPETADRLFQSFTQADASTTRKHGGTGLGLAICKRLVELMGGKIGVRSTLEQGSTFWFLVPMRKSILEVPSARRDLKGVRVLTLITDAELAVRVSRDLRTWGVIEETAADPADALSKMRATAQLGESWAYELALIDAGGIEPHLTEMLAEMRQDEALKNIRIVVASRSDNLVRKINREFGVLVMRGALRTEPLRRVLYRLFDVEGRVFGKPELTPGEIYEDLNVSAADMSIALGSAAAGTGEFSGQVLLVEDNPVNLGVMQRALSKLGLICETATDGNEALLKCEAQRFNLIFMDCQMPVMDGYEATRRIRQLETEQDRVPSPIVAMTANAMAGDRERCIVAGMDDYLAKPVSIAQLRSCISRWLASAQSPRSAEPEIPPEVRRSQGSASVLDELVLAELREIMGEDYLRLLQTYLDSAPQLIADAHSAVASKDQKALLLSVHSLKSSSANVGANQLSQLARDTERLARDGDLEEAQHSLAAVDAAFRSAEALLLEHLASYSAAGAHG